MITVSITYDIPTDSHLAYFLLEHEQPVLNDLIFEMEEGKAVAKPSFHVEHKKAGKCMRIPVEDSHELFIYDKALCGIKELWSYAFKNSVQLPVHVAIKAMDEFFFEKIDVIGTLDWDFERNHLNGIIGDIFSEAYPGNSIPVGPSNSVLSSGPVDSLRKACPALRQEVDMPTKSSLNGRVELYYAIQILNDTDRWTREQIADWLEALDIDIRVQLEE